MGGRGSRYSKKDIQTLKDTFKKELEEDDSEVESTGRSGLFGLGSGDKQEQIVCPDGTRITIDANEGELTFDNDDVSATLSFETYEDEFADEYSDYCEAAEEVLEEYGE